MRDIPTLGRPHEMPPIRNSDDLWQRWRALTGPLGFGQPRLWLAFLEPDDKMSAQLTQIEDIPRWAETQIPAGPVTYLGSGAPWSLNVAGTFRE